MTRDERRTHWRGIIDGQIASGKSINAYCRDVRIKTDLFYSWRRRLRGESSTVKGFVELLTDRSVFSDTNIRIHLDRNLCIEVGRGFDPVTLRSAVKALCDLHRCSA